LTAAQVRHGDGPTLQALADGLDVRRGRTGETVAELAVRARAAADDVVAALAPGETGLVVCHGITSRALVASLVALEQMHAVLLLRGLGNCRWATVTQTRRAGGGDGPSAWRIDEWNAGAGDVPVPSALAPGPDLGTGHAIG
ncbi:MAG: histidine phosphatase family protein, partial [Actinomycetota bacterium]|nr:histidine phosphatase family protein [Actinomycetota bacterium]